MLPLLILRYVCVHFIDGQDIGMGMTGIHTVGTDNMEIIQRHEEEG